MYLIAQTHRPILLDQNSPPALFPEQGGCAHGCETWSNSKGADVERINDFALYELADALKALSNYNEKISKSDVWSEASIAVRALNDLLSGSPLTIEFSKQSAQKLRDFLVKEFINNKDGEEYDPYFTPEDEEETIWGHIFRRYRRLLLDFETIFGTEMRDAATYFVPRRGIFHTPSLIDHADEAFPTEVKNYVPGKSKEDWKAAGRCLAFSLHSASGFHVTRAVEGILEKYYQKFCNKGPEDTLHGWHDYIEALKKVNAAPTPSDKTLSQLTQMKDDFRNPLAHPRVVLSETDARMLFDNGESLILAMASEIKEA